MRSIYNHAFLLENYSCLILTTIWFDFFPISFCSFDFILTIWLISISFIYILSNLLLISNHTTWWNLFFPPICLISHFSIASNLTILIVSILLSIVSILVSFFILHFLPYFILIFVLTYRVISISSIRFISYSSKASFVNNRLITIWSIFLLYYLFICV